MGILEQLQSASRKADTLNRMLENSPRSYLHHAEGQLFSTPRLAWSKTHDILTIFQQLILPHIITDDFFAVDDSVVLAYLADITFLSVCDTISLDQNRRLMLSILLFNETFYNAFGPDAYKPNNHGLLHLPHQIFLLGPPPCFWSFWLEGLIRQAKKYRTSGMYHDVVLRCRICRFLC